MLRRLNFFGVDQLLFYTFEIFAVRDGAEPCNATLQGNRSSNRQHQRDGAMSRLQLLSIGWGRSE